MVMTFRMYTESELYILIYTGASPGCLLIGRAKCLATAVPALKCFASCPRGAAPVYEYYNAYSVFRNSSLKLYVINSDQSYNAIIVLRNLFVWLINPRTHITYIIFILTNLTMPFPVYLRTIFKNLIFFFPSFFLKYLILFLCGFLCCMILVKSECSLT